MYSPVFYRVIPYNKQNVLKILQNGIFARKFHKSNKVQDKTSQFSDTNCDLKYNHMDIGCKVAVVTGGSSGIGFAIANQLLCCGAKNVAITGIDACKGREAANVLNMAHGRDKAMFVNCSVNCMVAFEGAFKVIKDAYKRIDIVVNAAGLCDGTQWEREIVTNVVGTVRGTLLGYRYVGKEGNGKGGVVVNISGITGLEPLPPAPTLCASHHAIVGLSRSFGDAIHLKRSGVRIVTLCAGFTQTDFLKNIAERGMTEEMGQDFLNVVKRAKLQKPSACGQAAIYLIQNGKSGSVWVIEGSRLFSVKMTNWQKNATLVAQFL